MPLVHHPEGQYAFLPGIAPYSAGVVALPGMEIAHVTLAAAIPWRHGFKLAAAHLAAAGRPRSALCAIELRSPAPFTFGGFAEFNAGYVRVLEDWGLFVNGVNPVARTNVAPAPGLIAEPTLHGFSYTRPAATSAPTFIVAGGGELPEGLLSAEAIVARGDLSPAGILRKASFVLDLMEGRLRGLGGDWSQVSAINVYTIHGIDEIVPQVLLPRMGVAALQGIRWFPTRPPIEEIEFEMDLWGIRTQLPVAA